MSFLKSDTKGGFTIEDAAVETAYEKDSSNEKLKEKIYANRIAALSNPKQYLTDKLADIQKIDKDARAAYVKAFKEAYTATGSEDFSRKSAQAQADVLRDQRMTVHKLTFPDQVIGGGVGEKLRRERRSDRLTE